MARVSKLYEESNGGDSAVAVGSLLERAEESDPGFSERVCAVLDSEAAVHDLTLRDVIGHIRLWHFEGRAVECGAGRLDGDMHRMARAVGKEWRRCTSCVRTAAAWWIAMTIECDLGLDRLARRVPKSGPGQPASPAERELARPRLATTLRVARLYQEFNHGSKMGPEELHDTVVDLLDTLKEYYPGFRERIAEALAAGEPGEAVLSLTLDERHLPQQDVAPHRADRGRPPRLGPPVGRHAEDGHGRQRGMRGVRPVRPGPHRRMDCQDSGVGAGATDDPRPPDGAQQRF